MTKEQILNGMSEEDFYNLYPDQASWENAQQMKLGGLSGAPHNGQPTAKEFFIYGSGANNGINIPMSNPFFLAYGGIPMDQQEGGFIDYNNNTTYPTFSQGGYEDGGIMNNNSENLVYQPGGQYNSDKYSDLLRKQKNNNMSIEGLLSSQRPGHPEDTLQDFIRVPLFKAREYDAELKTKIKNHPENLQKNEDGGSVISLINQLTKLKKKAYGGASTQQGGNQNHIEKLRSTFDNVISNNVHNALVNEQADAVKEMYRTGGLMQAQTGTGVNPSFSAGYDNQVRQDLYKQNIDKNNEALNGSFKDMLYSGKRNNYYPNYYQGMNYMPMNYSPMNKISKEDDAMYKALQKNPSSRLTGYKNTHFGPFGSTKFTFGYKDQNAGPIQLKGQAPTPYKGAFNSDSGIPMRMQGPEEGYNFQKDATIKNPYLLNAARPTSVINPNSTDANQQVFPSYRKIDYMHKYLDGSKQNIQTPSSGPSSSMLNAMDNSVEATDAAFNKIKKDGIKDIYKKDAKFDIDLNKYQDAFEKDSKFDPTGESNKNEMQILSPQRYGGLYKAQYGVDHKSTNPMDGTYDNYGNIISSGSNGMTGGWGTSFGNTTPTTSGMFPGGPTAAQTTPALAGMPSMPAGSNPAIGMTMSGTSGTEANDKLAPVLKQTTTDLGNASGSEKEVTIKSKQRPNLNPEAVVNWTNAGMNVVSNIFNKARDRSQEQLANMQLADNASVVNNQENRGVYDFNSGDFKPDKVLTTKYGGYMQEGGNMQQPDQEQIVQGVAQMLQQGAQPEQIAQQLIQMGLPQEQAMQLIQTVMQNLQGGQEEPTMKYGGYAMGGGADEEDVESWEDDLTEDEIAELRNGGYNVQYI